jgi:hypothetical protein
MGTKKEQKLQKYICVNMEAGNRELIARKLGILLESPAQENICAKGTRKTMDPLQLQLDALDKISVILEGVRLDNSSVSLAVNRLKRDIKTEIREKEPENPKTPSPSSLDLEILEAQKRYDYLHRYRPGEGQMSSDELREYTQLGEWLKYWKKARADGETEYY